MKDRVLVDTSVWISYFKNADGRLSEKVDDLLSHSVVCVPKVVIAELIQGAKTEKEISVIEGFFEAFTIIDQSEDTWKKAGRLSFDMKRKGITAGVIDCYIAVMGKENDCDVLTLDTHFTDIRRFLKIDLV